MGAEYVRRGMCVDAGHVGPVIHAQDSSFSQLLSCLGRTFSELYRSDDRLCSPKYSEDVDVSFSPKVSAVFASVCALTFPDDERDAGSIPTAARISVSLSVSA